MNVPNLVNLQSGSWGSVIVDGLNITRSTTLANFNTLASLVTYASTSASDDWRSRFFRAATPSGGTTPSNTLEAMAGIARQPWAHPKDLFALVRGGVSAGEGRFAERGAVCALPDVRAK